MASRSPLLRHNARLSEWSESDSKGDFQYGALSQASPATRQFASLKTLVPANVLMTILGNVFNKIALACSLLEDINL
jgi:hypothetical protein